MDKMTEDSQAAALLNMSTLDALNASLCVANDTFCLNSTWSNVTKLEDKVSYSPGALDILIIGLTSTVLGLMILVTIIGNVFVIAAILLEKNLQSVANYLIVSLAVADLMVACLVMPLGAVYVISKDWILGPELCDMWTSCDVLCCTASILHLVAIAVDRFWAVTDVDYIHTRNIRRIGTMITLVWSVALTVSLAPQFGWKDPDYLTRINEQKCLVSQDVGYQIFATCSTFYVPLIVILILYWKIFQAARTRIRKSRTTLPITTADVQPEETTRRTRKFFLAGPFRMFRRGARQGATEEELIEGHSSSTQQTTAFIISETQVAGPSNVSPERSSGGLQGISGIGREPMSTFEISPAPRTGTTPSRTIDPVQAQREKKESLEAKRERKAAKTLAIITGAFVICWLPFFIIAILTPFIGPVSDPLANFILWLGYFNSTLNPVIYTIFSPEFKQAFKRILFGRSRNPIFR